MQTLRASGRRIELEVFAAFAAAGVVSGSWFVSVAELKLTLGLTDGEIGTVVTIAAVLVLVPQLFYGRVISRIGRPTFPISLLITGSSILAMCLLPQGIFLVSTIALIRLGMSFSNVCINAAALHHEHATGRHVMTTMHAAFSLGAIPGPLFVGFALSEGGSLQSVYFGIAAVVAVEAFLLNGLTRDLKEDTNDRVRLLDRSLFANRPLLLMSGIAACGAFGEGAMYLWTTIYLRDGLGQSSLISSAGATFFFLAMTIGRFGCIPVQRRLGRVGTLTVAGATIATGMLLALATINVVVVLIGILFAGMAFAVAAPIAISLAGSLAPGKASSVSSFIWFVNGIASLIQPIIIGSLSNTFSLRQALLILPLTGAVIVTGCIAFKRFREAALLSD